jgi:hypothetical protein
LIYICISPYAHIPNLKLRSYGSGTTEGIRGGYTSTEKIFYANLELQLSEIMGLPLDERVEGSR